MDPQAIDVPPTPHLALLNVAETILRLPALVLMELWYLKRDVNIVELTEQMADQNPLPGFLNVTQIMEFIHRRHLERSAGTVLGYSGLFSFVSTCSNTNL
jgi:hypothetical protein